MTQKIITKPYPDIELAFAPGNHSFRANGKPVGLTVSAIANIPEKEGLKYYYANEMEKELKEKLAESGTLTDLDIGEAKMAWKRRLEREAAIGTEVHKYAELFFKGGNPELPENEKAKKGVLAFLKWQDEKKLKIVETEFPVFSQKYGYAGIMDLLAEVDSKLCVIDYKTSAPKNPFPECCETWARELAGKDWQKSKLAIEKTETGYTCKNCGNDCRVKTDSVYSSNNYQTALYVLARSEMEPADGRIKIKEKDIEGRWIIRLDKLTAQFEAHYLDRDSTSLNKDIETAKCLIKVAKREKKLC